MKTTLAIVLLLAASATASHAVSVLANAEELPPWYSYGKPSNNNPYDFTDRPSFPNGNAGYAGSELPPSDYQPDALSRELRRERQEASSELFTRGNPWCGYECGRLSDPPSRRLGERERTR